MCELAVMIVMLVVVIAVVSAIRKRLSAQRKKQVLSIAGYSALVMGIFTAGLFFSGYDDPPGVHEFLQCTWVVLLFVGGIIVWKSRQQ